MHSIADVSLRENGTEQRRGRRGIGRGRNGGRSDEAPTPSKRHRRRKEVNSPRSVLFKSLYGGRREGESKRKDMLLREREAEDAAQLNCP